MSATKEYLKEWRKTKQRKYKTISQRMENQK